jgi:hypothetical protein
MNLPDRCRDLLLSDREPGEIYRLCLQELQGASYAVTETVVYGCEVRYALDVLEGRTPQLYNFGDLGGAGDRLLWSVLDPLPLRRVAFLGSGPYPVTALLVRQRYPDSQVLCVDQSIVGFLLGRAVAAKLGQPIEFAWSQAAELDYGGFTAVVVAAMVGDKTALARRLLDQTEAEIVVRGEIDLEHPRLHTLGSGFSERDGCFQG